MTRIHAIEVMLPIEGRMPFFCGTQVRELGKWLKAKTRDDQGMAYSLVSSTIAPSCEYHKAGWIVTIVFNTYGDDLQVNELMEMIKDRLTALSIDHRKISEHGTVKKHDDTEKTRHLADESFGVVSGSFRIQRREPCEITPLPVSYKQI